LRLAEDAHQFGRIGQIEHEAIDRHQTHAAVKGIRRLGCRQQLHDLFRQPAQRSHAQTVTCLAQGRASWHPDFATLQPSKHLPITVGTKQSQANDKPNHEPARQPFAKPLPSAGLFQDRLHGFARNDTLQSRQPLIRRQLHNISDFLVESEHRSLLARWGLGHTIMAGSYIFFMAD
jgi:hypothetical protein